MPDFSNPFSGMNAPRKLKKEELINAVRFALAAEHEATQIYNQIADSCDDPVVQKVMRDVANEEIVHAGEFTRLLKMLNPDEEKLYQEGEKEVDEMQDKKASISVILRYLGKSLQ